VSRVLIASGCDANYFELIEDLFASLFVHEQARTVDFAVFDVGLTGEQRERLSEYTNVIVEPGWDVEVPERFREQPFLRAFTLVPFIPRYLPGYDVYIWLDADTWVQEWFPIDYLLQGVRARGFAIVSEVDRSYTRPHNWARVKLSLGGRLARVRTWNWTRYKRFFGLATAHALMFHPLLNSGVFAMRGDAPHWAAWADSFQRARLRTPNDLCDQSMLMHAVYTRDLPVALLPAVCNWTQARDLAFDAERRRLVEPNVPYAEIGIVHLVGDSAEREFEVPCLDGGTLKTRLTYRAMRERLGTG
jgi:hypothetical protein